MLLGKITGTLVASRKDENLQGLRFMFVEEMDVNMKPTGKAVVAVDAVGAGVGEVILFAQGSSARQTNMTQDRPVDATIMAIVDELDVEGKLLYRKE